MISLSFLAYPPTNNDYPPTQQARQRQNGTKIQTKNKQCIG